ncbi:MAG: hypothetical protein U0637_00500 [Phycisphaerales bacterium]
MTMLVHLIDARETSSIKRTGIKGQAASFTVIGTRMSVACAVFAMPVLPNYFASHQWLRELKRRGMRTIAAAYFRQRADTLVWVGRYNKEHRRVPLGHAAGLIMKEADPRGWQIIIPGSIPPKSIHAVRPVPQVVGWRYFPESHKDGPWKCLCDGCLGNLKGEIKSRKLIDRLLEKDGPDSLSLTRPLPRRTKKRRASRH